MPRELTDRVPTLEEELADDNAATSSDAMQGSATATADEDASTAAPDSGDAGAEDQGSEDTSASADDTSADAESGAAVAADVGDDGKGQSSFVPVGRFNEVNERRKNVEEENRQLREMLGNLTVAQARGAQPATTEQQTAAKSRDFDKELESLQERYEAGELDDAAFKREERKLIREQTRAEVMQEISPVIQDVQQERERLRVERMQDELNKESAKAIERYPFLDSQSDATNKEAIAAVLAERDALIKAGIPAGKALRMAVNEVAPQYGEAVAPASNSGATKSPDEVAAQRRANAQRTAAKVESTQPPPVAGAGNGPRTISKQSLGASVKDHEKWQSIPEAERAKALGA